jgi:hypothetical protein
MYLSQVFTVATETPVPLATTHDQHVSTDVQTSGNMHTPLAI